MAVPPADWKEGERDLRQREVRGQEVGRYVQIFGVILTAGALVAAAFAAWKAGEAVEVAQRGVRHQARAVETAREGIERQADEARLSTVIGAIGGELPAERVAGFTLLRRHVEGVLQRVRTEGSPETERDAAFSLYKSALDILENYLKNPVVSDSGRGSTPDGGGPSGLGFGEPDRTSDSVYAATTLRGLLELQGIVGWIGRGEEEPVSVDLTRAQLYGQPWSQVDFSWLGGHYFQSIDLRGASLVSSDWGGSYLGGAFLQCADLSDASFAEADLTGADLRGAQVTGASFEGATLSGARVIGVVGARTAEGFEEALGVNRLERKRRGTEYDRMQCLQNKDYWAI